MRQLYLIDFRLKKKQRVVTTGQAKIWSSSKPTGSAVKRFLGTHFTAEVLRVTTKTGTSLGTGTGTRAATGTGDVEMADLPSVWQVAYEITNKRKEVTFKGILAIAGEKPDEDTLRAKLNVSAKKHIKIVACGPAGEDLTRKPATASYRPGPLQPRDWTQWVDLVQVGGTSYPGLNTERTHYEARMRNGTSETTARPEDMIDFMDHLIRKQLTGLGAEDRIAMTILHDSLSHRGGFFIPTSAVRHFNIQM